MESKSTTETTIILTLNELEAGWLKGLVQNPINVPYKKEEDFERNMRQSFWNALSVAEPDKYVNAVKQV